MLLLAFENYLVTIFESLGLGAATFVSELDAIFVCVVYIEDVVLALVGD